MNPLSTWSKVALLAVVFGLGWLVNGWRLNAEISDIEATASKAASTAAQATLTLQNQRDAVAAQLRAKLGTFDTEGQTAQTKAKNENNLRTACLRDGSCILRVKAQCPPAASVVPGTGTRSSVDSGGSAVLTSEAGRSYSVLREAIVKTESTLTACQRSLGLLTGQTP